MANKQIDFVNDGFSILANAFDQKMIDDAKSVLAQRLAENSNSILKGRESPAYGARNLLQLWPQCVEFLHAPALNRILLELLGPHAGVVRGLYFDKPPGHSWALPWHRDFTVAVKEHGRLGAFAKPTLKAGVPHVEAPRSLLESMVTVRIHLDAMDVENGALRVMPGSHRLENSLEPVTIQCHAGDVLLMRPLLLHASGHSDSTTKRHRRIVHLECASSPELPDGYQWRDFISIMD